MWRWHGVCVLLVRSCARTAKGADGLTAFQCAFQRASHPRAMPAAWEGGGGGRARLFGVYLADAAGQTEFRFKS